VITKEELAGMVATASANGVVRALKKELAKERAKRAKAARAKLQKSGSADLARNMAVQAARTRQRAQIADLAARFEATTDPVAKSNLGQELTFARLKLAHEQGRI
jgi:hypothetical protein